MCLLCSLRQRGTGLYKFNGIHMKSQIHLWTLAITPQATISYSVNLRTTQMFHISSYFLLLWIKCGLIPESFVFWELNYLITPSIFTFTLVQSFLRCKIFIIFQQIESVFVLFCRVWRLVIKLSYMCELELDLSRFS